MQLLTRLSDKRAAVEKEFNKIPAAPKVARDIFQLCRGFERAFAQTLEVSCRVISTAIGGLACFLCCLATACSLISLLFTLQTVGYSAMIREAFAGDKGLSGTVRRLPIERQFRLDNVKMV